MPAPCRHRHPLFLRLLKPVEAVYPDAITRVAWDDDEMLEDGQGTVYIVTRHCAQMRRWAQQLRRLHDADEAYKTEEGVSSLSGAPLREKKLRALGTRLALHAEQGNEVQTYRSATHAYFTTDLLAIVTECTGANAVGFVSFSLQWVVDAFDVEEEVELELELDQAWIAPAFRRRCWGELAVIAAADAVRRHMDYVHATTRWPRDFIAKLELTVCADLYSTSGGALLRKCADYVAMEFDLCSGLKRLEVSRIVLDGRW